MIFLFKRHARLRDLARNADRARDARSWPEAALAYRTLLTRYPEQVEMWVQYGHALKESGYLVDAELAYQQAINRCATNADSYLQLGHVLKLQHKRDEAIEAYKRAFCLDPSATTPSIELKALGINPLDI